MTQTHHFELFFDLRAPAWTGRSVCDTYNDAADICAWVDDRQFESVTIGEHHMVDDHYISAPLIMCGAFAARTKQLRLKPILLASFYEPIRLAEELNVLQVLSRGRVVPVISGGYRKVEFDLFGKRPSDRLNAVDEVIEVLRASRAGEPFHYRGRAVPRITPVPEHPLPILMAATYPRIARHAAGNGADGLAPNASVLFAEYAREVVRLGRPDPGPFPAYGPHAIYVARTEEAAWEEFGPHLSYWIDSYRQFSQDLGEKKVVSFDGGSTIEELKANPDYLVTTPEGLVDFARRMGPDNVLRFWPLMGGLDPRLGKECLRLVHEEVMPHLNVAISRDIRY